MKLFRYFEFSFPDVGVRKPIKSRLIFVTGVALLPSLRARVEIGLRLAVNSVVDQPEFGNELVLTGNCPLEPVADPCERIVE